MSTTSVTNSDKPLTLKQKRFVLEYLVDGNGTQAAIRAGYHKRSAGQMAYQLLHETPKVSEAIEAVRKVQAEKINISLEWWLLELKIRAMNPLVKAETQLVALRMIGQHFNFIGTGLDTIIATPVDESGVTIDEAEAGKRIAHVLFAAGRKASAADADTNKKPN